MKGNDIVDIETVCKNIYIYIIITLNNNKKKTKRKKIDINIHKNQRDWMCRNWVNERSRRFNYEIVEMSMCESERVQKFQTIQIWKKNNSNELVVCLCNKIKAEKINSENQWKSIQYLVNIYIELNENTNQDHIINLKFETNQNRFNKFKKKCSNRLNQLISLIV